MAVVIVRLEPVKGKHERGNGSIMTTTMMRGEEGLMIRGAKDVIGDRRFTRLPMF